MSWTRWTPKRQVIGAACATTINEVQDELTPLNGRAAVTVSRRDIKFSEPDVGGGYEAFQYRQQLAMFAALGIPIAVYNGPAAGHLPAARRHCGVPAQARTGPAQRVRVPDVYADLAALARHGGAGRRSHRAVGLPVAAGAVSAGQMDSSATTGSIRSRTAKLRSSRWMWLQVTQ